MDKRYLVISPVIFGRFHQDEVLSPNQLGDAKDDLLSKGAIREMDAADSLRLEALMLKAFVLPTDANTFTSWMENVTGTNKICRANFRSDIGHHEFPVGNGKLIVGRSPRIPVSHPDGYLWIGIQGGYWEVTDISPTDLQKHEPISFRILMLAGNSIRVQGRCGVSALANYYDTLLQQIQMRWPEADLRSSKEVSLSTTKGGVIMENRTKTPFKVMCCYSHKEKSQRERVETHLALMKRKKLIEIWYDRKITAGLEWVGQIDDHLEGSDIILLFVSADFIDSTYCFDVEMTRALERHRAGEARVIPIIVRKCTWKQSPLQALQALPTDGLPVDQWPRSNDAYHDIAEGIQKVVDELFDSIES